MKRIIILFILIVLVVILIWLSCIISDNLPNLQGNTTIGENHVNDTIIVGGDLPPSVFVNDTLYRISYVPTSYSVISKECILLGEVKECVGTHNVPVEDFQANHAPVGTKIYQYYDNVLLFENDVYVLYVVDE